MVQFHTGNNPKITVSQRLEKTYLFRVLEITLRKTRRSNGIFGASCSCWDWRGKSTGTVSQEVISAPHKRAVCLDLEVWVRRVPENTITCNYFSLDLLIIASQWCLRSKLHRIPSWVISVPKLVSKCCCLFYQTTSSSLLSHGCCYFKLLKIKRQFRGVSYCLDFFFPLPLGLAWAQMWVPLGVLSVNWVQPSDLWWWTPLLHLHSEWQQWWVNAERASGSAAILSSCTGEQISLLPANLIFYHRV